MCIGDFQVDRSFLAMNDTDLDEEEQGQFNLLNTLCIE